MGRFLSKQKEAIGLSPFDTLFRGEIKSDTTQLRIIDFNKDSLTEKKLEKVVEALKYQNSETTTWFNIDGLHDEQVMQDLTNEFKIDRLAISDILDTHIRPKVQDYESGLFISLKMLSYNDDIQRTVSENLVIFIQNNLLISFQEKQGDVFEPLRNRIRSNKKRLRNGGTDYLAFALLDIVIDNYIYLLSRLGEDIENIDDEVVSNPTNNTLEAIYKYKSEINYMRKIVKPCRDLIYNLLKLDSDFIKEETMVHFKELEHNINHAIESVENYSTLLSDQLSVANTIIGGKLNAIMKTLTIFSVIFIPTTFIAGIYGTNFDNIPELHLKYGYFYMWSIIILMVSGMLVYFKKKKWF